MRYKLIKILSCNLAICCLASCRHAKKQDKYADTRQTLNSYLRKNFHQTINKDSTRYLLISQYACGGCVGGILEAFKEDARSVFIINQATKNKYFSDAHMRATLLVDTTNDINRLSLHQGGIGIIQASNGAIDTIIHISFDSLQEQINMLK